MDRKVVLFTVIVLLHSYNLRSARTNYSVKSRNTSSWEFNTVKAQILQDRIIRIKSKFSFNITHIKILDRHNTVLFYWMKTLSKGIYFETKNLLNTTNNISSSSFFYKLQRNDLKHWKLRNITNNISDEKIERIRGKGQKSSNVSTNTPDLLIESYQIKILPKNTFRLIKTNPRKRNKIRLFEAEFGEKFPILDFVYVDYSEDTLFFCALHDEVDSSLFTAFGKKPDSKIFQFSPSLSNVLCINPQKNFPDTWLSSSVAGATLIDMHLSLSSRGVIFASQFKHKLNLTEARMLHVDHFQTMVSFDFGKTWSVLRLRNDCKMDEKEPRLYLDLSFSRLFFDKPFLGILESSHIPGLIVSTGHLMYAHDTETYPGVFGSQNGGLTWTKLFDERFLIAMSTDGEFLAGIRQCLDGPTQQIFISYDFGHSWTSRRIFRRDACVHEILTSPFDVLAMLSSRPVEDVWIISVVDFDRSASSVHKCQRKDIQLYPLGSGRQFCVHGQKIMHYRRNPDVQCKILNYEHKFLNFSCDCTEKDFICTNESCRFMDREELRINLTQAKSNKEIPIIASRFGFKLEPWNECVFSRNPFHKRSSFYLPKCQTKVKKSSNIEEFPSRATGSISPLLGALFYAISSLALFCIRL